MKFRQLDFLFGRAPSPSSLEVAGRTVPLQFAENRQARRYILRWRTDGVVRVTIPRGGTRKFALDFAQRHVAWLEKQQDKLGQLSHRSEPWTEGTLIYFRGERQALHYEAESGMIHLAGEKIPCPPGVVDWRPVVEKHLRQRAEHELKIRTGELAAAQNIAISRVTVRAPRTRWGSCSIRGTISLNWRLIQTPAEVRDYLIWHELMHRREMNHSARFWHQVETVCPNFREAEAWLKNHERKLL